MNVYREFAKDVVATLLGNVSITVAHGNALNLWSLATLALTKSWQSGTDPALQARIDAINSDDDIKNLFKDFFSDATISNWSSSAIIDLMQKISAHGDKDSVGNENSSAQQIGGAVSAKSSMDTSTGESEGKALTSIVQQDSSAQQPIADAGTAVTGILSAAAGAQAQIAG